MAWRLHDSVVRGEVDNRVAGHVAGRIWLFGRPDPVTLNLAGNCLQDLAGCFLRFDNPAPKAGDHLELHAEQQGLTGDMTASRKVRVFDVPLEQALALAKAGQPVPEHKANCLYLEWYSDFNGRVVIESVDYTLTVSEPEWTMSDEQDRQQRQANQQAIMDWMERLGNALAAVAPDAPAPVPPQDEFEWEKHFRESDALTDKYLAVLEKYKDHPDRERLIARAMGWKWIEEGLAAADPGREDLPPVAGLGAISTPPLDLNPLSEGVDWVRDAEGRIHHPLAKQAFDLSAAMWHCAQDRGLLGPAGDADLREMIFQVQTTAAKLAGALSGLAYEDKRREPGFVVAALKRALVYLNQSIGASERVAGRRLLEATLLQGFRDRLFELREQVLALMTRFREKQ